MSSEIPSYRKIIRQTRPERRTTRSSRFADYFDRSEADPLGLRRVSTQVAHDLFGTKDVQDAITASYVWMADQIGHITLGLLPTLTVGGVWQILCRHFQLDRDWSNWGCVVVAIAIFCYWIYKERQDYIDTFNRAGRRFPFDSSDIRWNVYTALLYFGAGGLLALSALIDWRCLLGAIAIVLWPALRVAYWWLRRKLAFQQAGLPYLYRLANFSADISEDAIKAVSALVNLKNRPVSLASVLFTWDIINRPSPATKHLLIAGPLGAGKTSLAVGAGTEFAFALGIGRYLTAAKLVEILSGPADPSKPGPFNAEYSDGRLLWPLGACELLIVDDVDGGLPTDIIGRQSAFQPQEFQQALKIKRKDPPLKWLRDRRSVWVLGDTTAVDRWKNAIASLMDIAEAEVMVIELKIPKVIGA